MPSTKDDFFMMCMMFFLGRNFVYGLLCTIKPKKRLKTFKKLLQFSKKT